MNNNRKAVLYVRVSTDDKGQNPERQVKYLTAWADSHDVQVVGSFIDEGTSAFKTNPWDRPRFREAVQAAQAHGAALLVEHLDRFTRQGSKLYGWAVVELERQDPPVALWNASRGGPDSQEEDFIGEVLDAVDAATAKKYSQEMGRKISSGMKAKGAGGRPKKYLTQKEYSFAKSRAGKDSVRVIAYKINEKRGIFGARNVQEALSKRGVSKSLVHEYLTGKRTVIQ